MTTATAQGNQDGEDVLRAKGIEIHDDQGRVRLRVGRLGNGDGDLYGIELHAGNPAVSACLTADDGSAALAVTRDGDTVIECRVSAADGEAPARLELGFAGSTLLVETTDDGALVASLPPQFVVRRPHGDGPLL